MLFSLKSSLNDQFPKQFPHEVAPHIERLYASSQHFLSFLLYCNPYFYKFEQNGEKEVIRIKLAQEVSFLNKAAIQYTLSNLPKESDVIIDGTDSMFIDKDVLEIIHNFKHNAYTKGTIVEILNIRDKYEVPRLKELVYKPAKNN